MDIRMYNVQYGDSFLLREQEAALLVDFGSDTPELLQRVADDIKGCTAGRTLSVLLSHFHADHINGFWETDLHRRPVETVYMPDIFAMRDTHTQLDFVQLSVLEDIFSAVVLRKRPTRITLYQLLQSLVKHSGRVRLLKRGSSFRFGSKQYQVLWPCFDTLRIDPRVERSVIELLAQADMLHFAGEEALLPDSGIARVTLGAVDAFIDAMLEAYQALVRGELTDRLLGHVQAAWEEAQAQLNDRLQGLSESLLAKLQSELTYIHSQGNRLSIVFHDEAVQRRSRLLMTGDCKTVDLLKLLGNQIANHPRCRISQRYEVIKVPHHGTPSYFCSSLPQCRLLLVSNGKPSARNSRWGRICGEYGKLYHHTRHCHMLCTNPRCELAQTAGAQKCTVCTSGVTLYADVTL